MVEGPTDEDVNDLGVLLGQWQNGLRELHVSHARLASMYERRSRWLGGSAAVIAAVVGTGIIGGLAKTGDSWGRAVFAVLSLLAALLSALQTFLNYPKLSVQHAAAATEFGSLRRECELLLNDRSINPGDLAKRAEDVRRRWTDVERKAPNLLQSALDAVKAELSTAKNAARSA